jgi:simple sugar transport system permease protein
LAEERTPPSSGSGEQTGPALYKRWIRIAILVALITAAILLSKWLVLLLLILLGLWPLTLLFGLVILAFISTWYGGWLWMKEWLRLRLRGLVVPALAVLTALLIGGLVLMFTDQEAYQAFGEGQIGPAIRLAISNLGRAYGALYEGALGNPVKIRQALAESFGEQQVILILPLTLTLSILILLLRLAGFAWASRRQASAPTNQRNPRASARTLAGPAVVIIAALFIGSLAILITEEATLELIKARQISEAFRLALSNLATAARALSAGKLISPAQAAEEGADVLRPILRAVRGPSDSLVQSVPYIFAGLAVALGFRAGLFNIGAEGQIGIGWLVGVYAGFSITGLPTFIHLPLTIAIGAAAAGLFASIAGILKARTGAHEVITTIMLNYVVYRLSEWLLCGPLEHTQGTCRTQDILETAYLPRFLDHPVTVHWGFVLALAAAAITGWFLFKTTWGFELRTVGANPSAARYGGMSVAKNFVLAMFLSGCLAGMGGLVQGLGITHNIALGFQAGYGFDSIALALLGKSHPAGVLGASILFGVLRAGAARMQSVAGIPTEIVQIVQSLVIVFIAAPAIIQAIYRLREARREEAEVTVFSRGWGA